MCIRITQELVVFLFGNQKNSALLLILSLISWGPCLTSVRPIDAVCLLVGTSKLKTVHLQGFWPKTVYLKCFWISVIKNRASSRLLAQNRVSQVFWDPIKNRVSPRSALLEAVYLKALLYIKPKVLTNFCKV